MSDETRIRLGVLLARAVPDIVEANLLLAGEDHDVDVPAVLARVDGFAGDARARGGDADAVMTTLRAAGLGGARHDGDEPDASFIDRVLDRGTGLPISLSALAVGVATRIGVPVAGVGLPGHFVVADLSGGGPRFFDPFHDWREIDRDECARLARDTAGVDLRDEHLAPVDAASMVLRMCANLRAAYLARRRLRDVLWCVEASLVARPGEPSLVRERIVLLAGLGRYDDAEGEARAYLARNPDTPERPALERQIAAVQDMRRSMN